MKKFFDIKQRATEIDSAELIGMCEAHRLLTAHRQSTNLIMVTTIENVKMLDLFLQVYAAHFFFV